MSHPSGDDRLVVWLYGTPTLELERRADLLRARVRVEALERWGLGSRVFSATLRLASSRFATDQRITRWFDNLLPEVGRAEMAAIHATSTRPFDLLRAIGLDSAGALVIGGPTDPAGPDRRSGPTDADPTLSDRPPSHRPVGLAEIDALVRDLPRRPLGDDGRLRSSLAGVQGKLLLSRLPDGTWAVPERGAPSTHILKPEPIDAPFGSSANEAVCTELARRCGLTPCSSSLLQLPSGRLCFVTERYDRLRSDTGEVRRLHQEDLCQVLDRAPGDKYERAGEHLLATTASLLARTATMSDVRRLLAQLTFHVAIGNADAHAKNVSLLHHANATLSLAPIYDVANTVLHPNRTSELSMRVNGVASIHEVGVDDLVAEARGWKLREAEARSIVRETLEEVAAELSGAVAGIWVPHAEEELVGSIAGRCGRLLAGKSAGT